MYSIKFSAGRSGCTSGFRFGFCFQTEKNKFLFAFSDPVLNSIKIKDDKYVEKPKSPGDELRGLSRNVAAEFAASFLDSISNATEVTCNPSGKSICNNTNLNWEVHLYCPGIIPTTKVKEDGAISITSTADMWWEKEAIGITLDSRDTIGNLIIIPEPRSDSSLSQLNGLPLKSYTHRYEVPDKKRIGVSLKILIDCYRDFGATGELRGEKFTLLFNGELNQSWVFRQDRHVMRFNEDIDEFSLYLNMETGILPYIQQRLPESASEKYDLMRMTIVATYLSKILSKGSF